MVKLLTRWIGFAAAGAGIAMSGTAGPAMASASCVANCNAANAQCSQAGKDQSICLRAWHQCKVGCSASAAPPALKVTQPSPGKVVIQTTPAKPAKH